MEDRLPVLCRIGAGLNDGRTPVLLDEVGKSGWIGLAKFKFEKKGCRGRRGEKSGLVKKGVAEVGKLNVCVSGIPLYT